MTAQLYTKLPIGGHNRSPFPAPVLDTANALEFYYEYGYETEFETYGSGYAQVITADGELDTTPPATGDTVFLIVGRSGDPLVDPYYSLVFVNGLDEVGDTPGKFFHETGEEIRGTVHPTLGYISPAGIVCRDNTEFVLTCPARYVISEPSSGDRIINPQIVVLIHNEATTVSVVPFLKE